MEAVSTTTSELLLTSREHGRCKSAQASLPPLKTHDAKDTARRDSVTSSSKDSGYNSDPEFSLSPLDNGPQGSCSFLLPSVSVIEAIIYEGGLRSQQRTKSAALLRKLGRKKDKGVLPIQPFGVTSNPIPIATEAIAPQLNWTGTPPSIDQPGYRPPRLALPKRLASNFSHNSHEDSVGKWIDESFPFHNRPKERVSSIVSLSSAGSGGDYSITDDSDEDLTNMKSPMFSKTTIKTIDLIIRKIEINLRYAAYLQHAGGQSSGRRQGSTSGASSSRRGSTQGLSSNGVGKRKGRNGADDGTLHPDDYDRDEDGPNKRRRVSIATTDDSESSGLRFACPFFKHDPMRYRNRRTCPGPGWPSVHRMKEHLYRSHAQPIYCPRCYTMFDADADLTIHLRSETDPCHMSNTQAIEGIDRNTEATLRRRTAALRPEEDKWRDVYLILFPGTEESDIPSPYYDTPSPTEESLRFRRELLHRIHRALVSSAEHDVSGAVEQSLLRRVAGIIQRCENEILSDFYAGATQDNLQQRHLQDAQQSVSAQIQPHSLQSLVPDQEAHQPRLHTRNLPPYQQVPDIPLSATTLPPHQQQHVPSYPNPPRAQTSMDQFWDGSVHDIPLGLPTSEIIDWNTVFSFGGVDPAEEGLGYEGAQTKRIEGEVYC